MSFTITREEKIYLRELAKKQLEYAMLPIMKERERNWIRHNDLQGDVPMIAFETWTFEQEVLPALRCVSPAAREIELQIQREILNHEQIGDDKVIPPYFRIFWVLDTPIFDIRIQKVFAKDSQGRDIGYHNEYPIRDLEKELPLLKPTANRVDREATLQWKAFVDDTIGDILPTKISMNSFEFSVTMQALDLMGMEALMIAMVDEPENVQRFMERIKEELMETIRWREREGLLVPNFGNDLLHQGSYGFSGDLPGADYREGNPLTTQNLWGYMDTEIVGLSPRMFGEFLFPHYLEASRLFGLISFGCCEPVHLYWEEYISKFPRLRKVSIASWTDEAYMGQALQGKGIIYHRKPSATYMGLTREFDEEGFRKDVLKTLACARGCKLEFAFRDVYTLSGDNDKPRRAVKILRELIDENWK